MSTSRVSLRPIVTWPQTMAPGESHLVAVDLSLDDAPGDWPYEREEYEVGCLLTGDSRFTITSVGDTTLVVHRFGGTYGPAKFVVSVAGPRDQRGHGLRLTLLTAGGVQFRQITLDVTITDRGQAPPVIPLPLPEGTGSLGLAGIRFKPYRFEAYEIADAPQPVRDGHVQPSLLLAAANRVVPFTSRADELQALHAWANDPRETLLAKLVFGPLGRGKSRLADEFAGRCASEGWTVLHARLSSGHDDGPTAAVPAEGRTLVMIDYAERWPVQALRELFADPVLSHGRALLLARTGDFWWQALAAELDTAGVSATALPLAPLTDSPADRMIAFRAAVVAFARLYGVDAQSPFITAPDNIASAGGSVLAIHMAALVAVVAVARDEVAPAGLEGCSAYLLDRERDYWHWLGQARRLGTSPSTMARAVFVASLMGPMSPAEGVATLRRAGIAGQASAADVEDVVRDHATCYPPANPGSVLEPMSPDQLAEDFLARCLLAEPGRGGSPDPWMTSTLPLLLAHEPGGYPLARAAKGVTVLVETASRWPHVGTAHLFPLLRERPELAIAAGGVTLAKLAELPDVDGAVLRAIEELLPDARRVDLDAGAAEVTARLARLSQGLDEVERARLYAALGQRLRNAGLPADAVPATGEAVAAYRHLARLAPAAFEPDLATSLSDYGARLAEAGRREEALSAASEALEISRRLAAGNPDLGEPGLAAALNNLSNLLGDMGRISEALKAITEAVAIRRRLARTDPGANLLSLALSLTNLSVQLTSVGRHAEALPAAEEAVLALRTLADASPASYLPDLATSLLNLTRLLRGLGRTAEALAPTREAISIRYELAAANPAAFQPDLALSVLNLGGILIELDRADEAVATVAQAADLYRELATTSPGANLPYVAMSQLMMSGALAELGRAAEAIAAIRDALGTYRALAASDPDEYESYLALALNNYASLLTTQAKYGEALAILNECTRRYRALATAKPFYRADLARSLNNQAIQLARTGDLSAALGAAQEATALYREQAATYPQYQEDLVRSERTLGWLRQRGED